MQVKGTSEGGHAFLDPFYAIIAILHQRYRVDCRLLPIISPTI